MNLDSNECLTPACAARLTTLSNISLNISKILSLSIKSVFMNFQLFF